MITSDYVKLMARYNTWQNGSLLRAADSLSDEERAADRGAFFGSIQGTLSHVLFADHIWLARFSNMHPPDLPGNDSSKYKPDWVEYMTARRDTDLIITNWAEAMDDAELNAQLSWHSNFEGRDFTQSTAMLVVHFFNHQTHHRGQVHAMLTAAGARPDDTDIPLMPDMAR